MKSIKNIVIGILAAACVAAPVQTLTSYASMLPEGIEGSRYEEPVRLLAALGIMVGDDNGEFKLEDNIKRSEVCKMAIHALGLDEVAESRRGESKFPDVSTKHWANGYINLATSQGIIKGDDRGNFRPDDSITYAEAMTIFTRVLGYEVMAEEMGGYPDGHVATAENIGLSKNVFGSTKNPITRGNVAHLANNALIIDMMERKGFGNDLSYEVTDKTLLEDKLNVTKHTGQVTATEYTSLVGDSDLNENEVVIGDKLYETSYNLNNLLGYNVVYYVHDDEGDERVILAVNQKEKNKTVSIMADLFEKITTKNENKAIEYFEKEDSSKSTIVALEDEAKLIYNGKALDMSDEVINMKDKSGKIDLLDTDRNGLYDIVFVTDYYNIVVNEVTKSGKITDKYGAPTIKLDDEEVKYTIIKGLQEIKIDELKEYDVLSVAQSKDKELFEIIVSNQTVSGKVSGRDKEGVIINGKHYKVASNYPEEITMGTEGLFYLDIEGKIAAINNKVTLSDNYGYLIKAYASDETEKATFKIFTKNGETKTFTANDKIRFNGVAGQKALEVVKEFISENKTNKQLITYTLNSEGNISGIYTQTDNTSTGTPNDEKFTLDYVMEEAVYNEKLSSLGSIKLNGDTIIFDIQADEDDYSIADIKMFEDKQKYNVMVFDVTEDFVAKAVVVTNAQFQTNSEAPIAIVDKITEELNGDEEQTQKLYALYEGKEIELFAEDEGILVKGENNAPLQKGDIIQYKTNEKGEIASVRVLFDINSKNTEMTATPVEDLEIVYGKVVKKFANSINVTVNDSKVRNISFGSDVIVYSVDTTKTKNNITVATTGDIQAFDEDEANRVFIKIYDEVVKEIVIIK